MSALVRIADSSRTSRELRKVLPNSNIPGSLIRASFRRCRTTGTFAVEVFEGIQGSSSLLRVPWLRSQEKFSNSPASRQGFFGLISSSQTDIELRGQARWYQNPKSAPT